MSRKVQARNGFDEAIRYYRNARELLARCKVEDDLYEDIKPVREAFGTAWLAIDTAIKAGLARQGLTEKQIPESWEPLRGSVARHLAVHNGKLMKLLNAAYEEIHLAGYYRGRFRHARLAKDAMQVARRVIETLSGRKIS